MRRRGSPGTAKRIGFVLFAVGVLTNGCGSESRPPEDDDDDAGGMAGTSGGTAGSAARAGAAGQGGSGMAGGGAGMAGSAGAPNAGCDGVELSQSGVLDLDVRAVTVSGRVTVAGSPLPNEVGSRGVLSFESTDGRSTVEVDLGSTGEKTYALRLPPGTYDVTYGGNAELCTWPNVPNLPCGSGRVVADAALTKDGVLDIDIPVVSVSGNVTLETMGFPETAKRGSIMFRGVGSDATGSVSLSPTGVASYRMNLLPGVYDVSFVGDPTECTGETSPAAPCNSGTLRTSVVLTSSGVLDLDVSAVRVTGVVTLNASLPPSEAAPRGQLAFQNETGEPLLSKAFGPSGAMTYEVVLLPGEYAVAYVPSDELCAREEVPSMPCVGGTVLASRELASDGVLDIDVRAVTVTGQVTQNGTPLPDVVDGASRGGLRFTNRVRGSGSPLPFQATGPGRYSVRLLAGSYDVDFVPNPALCAGSMEAAVPCTGGSVGRNVTMEADGVYDVDLERIRVAGAVTLNGAPMPTAPGERGAVTFTIGEWTVMRAPFPASGAAAYALSLWPGAYRVDFDANEALCGVGLPAPPVPCVGGTLIRAASLEMDGVLDLDVRSVTVSGNVTLNGAPGRPGVPLLGSIEVVRTLDQGSDRVSIALGETTHSYAATLMAGRHLFLHAPHPERCTGAEPAPDTPCALQVLLGCGQPP